MDTLLSYTAWMMNEPEPWGIFHILMLLVGVPVTIFLGWKTRHISQAMHQRLLFILGMILILLELYKQLFSYAIVNHHTYDWWIFPFQLCSLPMYLCVLLPFLKKHSTSIIETFLMDFTILGASMALLFPDDMMHSYITLTAHAFLWHFILLFIGFHIAWYRKTFAKYHLVILLFIFTAVLATCFNMIFHIYGDIDMFYISPYMPFSQPVFDMLEPIIGRIPTILIYLVCACGGGLLIQKIIAYKKHP
ncbi:YwaF family protein [Absiella sp. AM29-15]|uniref:TMEM164 family acyltransferase n=1 Tax=Absiella sp. AM29-15 TaxID=2292278 RepID=UPI000E428502|nr:YwaF family protein [Absiella sp. AM29-15]RGC52358.1 hypothetical protein DW761_07245 [Absiella sp. AM29-15]